MKTTLIMVGKTTNKMYSEAIDDYCRRIGHYTPFNIKVIPELKNAKSLSERQQKEKEGALILKAIEDKSTVVLLDEHGKEMRRQTANRPSTHLCHRRTLRLCTKRLRQGRRQNVALSHDFLPPDGAPRFCGTGLPCLHHHQKRTISPRVKSMQNTHLAIHGARRLNKLRGYTLQPRHQC